jgi:hypothetical protein
VIEIPVSPGELLDKISILEIKARRIVAPEQRRFVEHELALLRERWENSGLNRDLDALLDELRRVNEKLWDIEDAIRESERSKRFDDSFIALARSVYQTNDRRAALKRLIDDRTQSPIREVKSYRDG